MKQGRKNTRRMLKSGVMTKKKKVWRPYTSQKVRERRERRTEEGRIKGWMKESKEGKEGVRVEYRERGGMTSMRVLCGKVRRKTCTKEERWMVAEAGQNGGRRIVQTTKGLRSATEAIKQGCGGVRCARVR